MLPWACRKNIRRTIVISIECRQQGARHDAVLDLVRAEDRILVEHQGAYGGHNRCGHRGARHLVIVPGYLLVRVRLCEIGIGRHQGCHMGAWGDDVWLDKAIASRSGRRERGQKVVARVIRSEIVGERPHGDDVRNVAGDVDGQWFGALVPRRGYDDNVRCPGRHHCQVERVIPIVGLYRRHQRQIDHPDVVEVLVFYRPADSGNGAGIGSRPGLIQHPDSNQFNIGGNTSIVSERGCVAVGNDARNQGSVSVGVYWHRRVINKVCPADKTRVPSRIIRQTVQRGDSGIYDGDCNTVPLDSLRPDRRGSHHPGIGGIRRQAGRNGIQVLLAIRHINHGTIPAQHRVRLYHSFGQELEQGFAIGCTGVQCVLGGGKSIAAGGGRHRCLDGGISLDGLRQAAIAVEYVQIALTVPKVEIAGAVECRGAADHGGCFKGPDGLTAVRGDRSDSFFDNDVDGASIGADCGGVFDGLACIAVLKQQSAVMCAQVNGIQVAVPVAKVGDAAIGTDCRRGCDFLAGIKACQRVAAVVQGVQ